MGYISGEDRSQQQLFPSTLEELIDENNPVRVIDAFIDHLNLSELGITHAHPAATGRPPYDPKALLKLYVYGYFNRIRSSRKLMTECGRNIELFYLLNRLTPDFRTIADFRKDNAKALKHVFKAFVKICLDLKLYERELIAIDGSKFRAVNGRKKMYNEEILKKKLLRIEENITNYLNALDQADQDDPGTAKYASGEIKEKLAELKKRQELYETYLQELKESEETQLLTTDPEARMMRTKDGYACCYNVQTAVDQTSHLIAEYEVTNSCNDYNYLTKVAQNTKETFGVETIHAAADKGYDDKEEIRQCVMNGIIPHVGLKTDKDERLLVLEHEEATISEDDRNSTKPEDIQRCLKAGVLPQCYENTIMEIEVQEQDQLSCFIRHENDTVTCPMGCVLTRVRTHRGGNARYQNRHACRVCTNRCTSGKNYKVVQFGPDSKYIPVLMYGSSHHPLQVYPVSETPYNAFKLLKRNTKKKVILHIRDDIPMQKLRLCLSEHPFGTVKWYHGAHYLLCKGIEKTTGELGLSFLAYNLRRAINMVGTKRLVAALRG
ncbi:transposase [Dehalobacter sp. DCM]|uniref:IS1182 family transposase n=1 Tax=Dehalobacter sp. DCM TaxID=2907827 RepID=UPI0030816851|nr:transposase [Dehalobacter sp. DCM]